MGMRCVQPPDSDANAHTHPPADADLAIQHGDGTDCARDSAPHLDADLYPIADAHLYRDPGHAD